MEAPYLCICGKESHNPRRDRWYYLARGNGNYQYDRYNNCVFIARACSTECIARALLHILEIDDLKKKVAG